MPSRSRHLVSLLTTGLLATAVAHAALPPVTPGERVLFSDDFIDNRHEWSSIAVVNTTGKPSVDHAAIFNSEWAASLPDSGNVSSSKTLKTAPNLADGPVSIYFSAKVADHKGTDGSRFSIALHEAAPSNSFVRLLIRPSNSSFIEFRNESEVGQSISIESTHDYFQPDSEPRIFKLTVTPSPKSSAVASAEAFRYDSKTKAYVSMGIVNGLVVFKKGEFDDLMLYSRNGDNGVAWVDSVVITQTPTRR